MITIAEYLRERQPWILELVWLLWPAPFEDEDELTAEQEELEKLMRQRPRYREARM